MERVPVSLTVAGQTYRVVASVPEGDLKRLACVVEAKLFELVPKGRPVPPTAMLLAALSLANELEEERTLRRGRDDHWRERLAGVLARIDHALAEGALEETPS